MQNIMKPENSEEAIRVASKDIFDKFGIRFTEVENGKACGELVLLQEHRNFYGIPYGGILFNLADNTAGIAFASAGGNGVTISGNVNFLRGAGSETEKLICQATVKKAGKHLFFVSAEIRDNYDTVLSEYSFVFTNLSK